MRTSIVSYIVLCMAAVTGAQARAQSTDLYSSLHWREIGPTRAGRARAVSGAARQPNVAYIGFDNGGVWRSTDYGSTWTPLFDDQSTGSIGAIAVAPSNPNIIYVGTGAGIIRPDLATGNGIYKSTDGGKTWTHLGLDDSQMIAAVDVDPFNPDRLFVAVLGHPYGPSEQRGVFRSTDGGHTFTKVLYRNDYTSANDVHIDPSNPNVVYASLWQQQEEFREGGGFGGNDGGLFKSTDGGTTWTELKQGLPSSVLEANIGISRSNPNVVYAMVAQPSNRPGTVAAGYGAGVVAFYKSSDAGAHWTLMDGPGLTSRPIDPRPLVRIGGGDLPTIVVDPKNENVVYSSSTVLWRTEDGGATWSAVRGAPGGDDYQKTWINPLNPDIIVQVADQGGVVSANRGISWSNWYNQPTAAMYHVSTDNTFVYQVCGGQQDSGSACVKSRSDDGEITFHDWHPVNIQEYGIAAPDPRDPDMVYGSMRTNVSLYNRKTGQTTLVGPDMSAPGPNGDTYNRNVRTMPIVWSPEDPTVLYYTSNAVWKSTDHAHSWTRISPDLARHTWAVPASAGNYASGVKPAPLGTITALSPSTRSARVLWAGTDDGNVQMTTNGGTSWTNVTPPAIKPWTRIFNIDAGHFDDQTAYIAANTMRIDDANPHFYRTHDGGKTWTEIDNGLAPGAAANAIREDPRQRGLLYAGTETQVWVSFDDGDHWQSLRQNMPAISVRDLQLKDDSACLCSDLIAGTHGRGYYILDNVTPLRQEAQARAANDAYLYKPAIAVRVRFATNDPTPWPPELPAGENPMPGGIIDYYLGTNAPGAVTLDILDAAGKVVRSYSSADSVPNPDPATDPAAYDQVCQERPTAEDCDLPLYWPAPPIALSTAKGMHRFSWDLRYQPVPNFQSPPGSGDDATGAVPHRTYPQVYAPWAPPGRYTIRLTVNGRTYTQPLTLRLDPRVKTTAVGLSRLASLSRDMYQRAMVTQAAYDSARAMAERTDSASALRARLDSLAPPPAPRVRGFGRRGSGNAPPTLSGAASSLMSAAMAMQGADVAPTATEIAACGKARAESEKVLAQWKSIQAAGRARH